MLSCKYAILQFTNDGGGDCAPWFLTHPLSCQGFCASRVWLQKKTLKSVWAAAFSNFLTYIWEVLGILFCCPLEGRWHQKNFFVFCLLFCKCNSQLLKLPSVNTGDLPCSAAGGDCPIYSSVSAELWKTRSWVPRSPILLCSDSLVSYGNREDSCCVVLELSSKIVRASIK